MAIALTKITSTNPLVNHAEILLKAISFFASTLESIAEDCTQAYINRKNIHPAAANHTLES
ncbi:MAG: hypothetical protein ABI045_02435 [Flavobacteriales bacterium]